MERPIRTESILWGIWGSKVGSQPAPRDQAIQISAQQTRIEIDVLNLGRADDLTMFRPMVFIAIPLNLAVCTQSFSISPRPVNPGAACSNPGRFSGYMGVKSFPTETRNVNTTDCFRYLIISAAVSTEIF